MPDALLPARPGAGARGRSVEELTVRSSIPGRVRWDVPRLVDRPDLVAPVVRALSACEGALSVRANPVTGRVLLSYRPGRSLGGYESALRRVPDGPGSAGDLAPASEPARPIVPVAATAPGRDEPSLMPLVRLATRTPRHKTLATRAIVAAFLDRLFEAAPPALIGACMDIVTRGPDSFLGALGIRPVRSQLAALGTLGAALWTADSLSGYFRGVAYADLASTIRFDLRNEIYRHLQTLDIGSIEGQAIGEWMDLLENDIGRISEFIEGGIDPLVTIATNVLIVAGTFLSFSPLLAGVQLLTVPGIYLVSTQLLGPIREREKAARTDNTRLSAMLHDNVAGIATIASSARQEAEARRVEEAGSRLMESSRRRYLLSSAYIPAIQMVVGCGFLATLVYGGAMVHRRRLSPGAYNLMGFSSLRLLTAMGRLGVGLEQYQRTRVSLDRVARFLDRGPSVVDGTLPLRPDAMAGEITFDRVTFGYEPDRPILRDLELRFPAGMTTGVVGPSGAGKTTLLKLILRFHDVDSGSVRLDGVDVRDYALDDLRREVAVVPQQIFLFAGSIRDNIAYARPDATDDEVTHAARIAEAHEFIRALPRGYETQVGEGGAMLSGGQKQRIGIARAVLADRPILLFDEATSAVDHETEASIQRSLRGVTEGRTTIVVAHRLSTIRHAGLIYVLDQGQVRERGSHEELIGLDGVYASMWRVQTGEVAPTGPSEPSDAGATVDDVG